MNKRENGFALIELLVAMVLAAILLTLSASAFQHYWHVRALEGGQSDIATQLRQLQERVVSESHPLVYGARFRDGSRVWATVRYNPETGSCSELVSNRFGSGVTVNNASFTSEGVAAADACKAQIPGASSDDFVFFYARGNATSGNVTVQNADGERSVAVSAITGRVTQSP